MMSGRWIWKYCEVTIPQNIFGHVHPPLYTPSSFMHRFKKKKKLYFPSLNGSTGLDFTWTEEEKTTSLRPSILNNFYWKIAHQMAPFRLELNFLKFSTSQGAHFPSGTPSPPGTRCANARRIDTLLCGHWSWAPSSRPLDPRLVAATFSHKWGNKT